MTLADDGPLTALARPGRSPSPRRRPLATARDIVREARPRQWTKNLLVASGPALGGVLLEPRTALRALLITVAWCLATSAAYLVNDVRDAENDRRHPTKRRRPIAAGTLAPGTAMAVALMAGALGLALAGGLSRDAGLLLAAYLLVTVAYSTLLKQVAFLELAVVAAGFVLRAASGSEATGVPLSRLFLVVLGSVAVLAVTGKRLGERQLLGSDASRHRAVLGAYPVAVLQRLLLTAAGVALVAYGVWVFRTDRVMADGDYIAVSAVPFAVLLLHYADVAVRGAAGDPFEVICVDRIMQVSVAVWAVCVGAGIYLT